MHHRRVGGNDYYGLHGRGEAVMGHGDLILPGRHRRGLERAVRAYRQGFRVVRARRFQNDFSARNWSVIRVVYNTSHGTEYRGPHRAEEKREQRHRLTQHSLGKHDPPPFPKADAFRKRTEEDADKGKRNKNGNPAGLSIAGEVVSIPEKSRLRFPGPTAAALLRRKHRPVIGSRARTGHW